MFGVIGRLASLLDKGAYGRIDEYLYGQIVYVGVGVGRDMVDDDQISSKGL